MAPAPGARADKRLIPAPLALGIAPDARALRQSLIVGLPRNRNSAPCGYASAPPHPNPARASTFTSWVDCSGGSPGLFVAGLIAIAAPNGRAVSGPSGSVGDAVATKHWPMLVTSAA